MSKTPAEKAEQHRLMRESLQRLKHYLEELHDDKYVAEIRVGQLESELYTERKRSENVSEAEVQRLQQEIGRLRRVEAGYEILVSNVRAILGNPERALDEAAHILANRCAVQEEVIRQLNASIAKDDEERKQLHYILDVKDGETVLGAARRVKEEQTKTTSPIDTSLYTSGRLSGIEEVHWGAVCDLLGLVDAYELANLLHTNVATIESWKRKTVQPMSSVRPNIYSKVLLLLDRAAKRDSQRRKFNPWRHP